MKKILTGLSLIALLSGCSIYLEKETTLIEGKADGNKVVLVKEIYKNEHDRYRLDVYDKNGIIRIQSRMSVLQGLDITLDDGIKINYLYDPK
ncbi:MAG TPA: membrane lipoprotein lipid attachment site-containing protein [Candidatus Nanoarchaeia archaeon]|nr:membrane lipoprotein lipid attachment site-containing protein [Candidatus Nanoarchaeia archaeon]